VFEGRPGPEDRHAIHRGLRPLDLVEQALERIRARCYGTCEECGGVIAKKRLEAIPFAPTCIRCAEKLENGGFGSGSAARPRQRVRRGRSGPRPAAPRRSTGQVVPVRQSR
jgi:RNA polymerase-binding transcription factor DksA